jgi:hypothetical protein
VADLDQARGDGRAHLADSGDADPHEVSSRHFVGRDDKR